MVKNEAKTDLWVYELLQEANIHLTPQGCDIKEIAEALKTASKSKTGKDGRPEYCGVVKDFILVIEDKASLDEHMHQDENGLLSQEVKTVKKYAVNGAYNFMLYIWLQIHRTAKYWLLGYQEMRSIIKLLPYS
ncbi:MAG: hypothetical protein LUF83_08525 [Alistipes sp.]|nr:hypothetical protein [Alistipes sp.]